MNSTLCVSKKSYCLDTIMEVIGAHPFITFAIMCFTSGCLFYSSSDTLLSPFVVTVIMVIFTIITFIAVFIVHKNSIANEIVKTCIFACCVVIGLVVISITGNITDNIIAVFLLPCAAEMLLLISWIIQKKLTTKRLAALIILLGFFLRLAYIMYTTIYERQHDELSLGDEGGHLGYITHFWNNLFSLPEGDVRNSYQYYHPPLHHFIAGAVLNIFKLFGYNDIKEIGEFIQFITMFYSCVCMVIMYKILRFFKINGVPLILGISIVAFHPTFIILSGSVNNDMLSIAFMAGAILNTLYYYRKPTFCNIIKVAICIGCAMMSKLSGWMVAPAIAVVFIVVLIKNKKEWVKILKQWAVFGVICVPLGLWYSVRNAALYCVPFNYVLSAGIDSPLYVGDKPYLERLTDFNLSQFASPYQQFKWYGCPYFEYNPTISLFKTSVFDEAQYTSGLNFWAWLLFWANIVLAIFSVAAMIYILVKKTKITDRIMKVFLFLQYIIPVVAYYIFCDAYPYTCTLNIRYTVTAIIMGALFFAMAVQNIIDVSKNNQNIADGKLNSGYTFAVPKIMIIISVALVCIFCLAAIVTYVMIGVMPAIFDGALHMSNIGK